MSWPAGCQRVRESKSRRERLMVWLVPRAPRYQLVCVVLHANQAPGASGGLRGAPGVISQGRPLAAALGRDIELVLLALARSRAPYMLVKCH